MSRLVPKTLPVYQIHFRGIEGNYGHGMMLVAAKGMKDALHYARTNTPGSGIAVCDSKDEYPPFRPKRVPNVQRVLRHREFNSTALLVAMHSYID